MLAGMQYHAAHVLQLSIASKLDSGVVPFSWGRFADLPSVHCVHAATGYLCRIELPASFDHREWRQWRPEPMRSTANYPAVPCLASVHAAKLARMPGAAVAADQAGLQQQLHGEL